MTFDLPWLVKQITKWSEWKVKTMSIRLPDDSCFQTLMSGNKDISNLPAAVQIFPWISSSWLPWFPLWNSICPPKMEPPCCVQSMILPIGITFNISCSRSKKKSHAWTLKAPFRDWLCHCVSNSAVILQGPVFWLRILF